jgi:hypothetical protein
MKLKMHSYRFLKQFVALIFLLGGSFLFAGLDTKDEGLSRIGIPESGKYYMGFFPGRAVTQDDGTTGPEDNFKLDDIVGYEKTIGKKVAWIYFSDNWFENRVFPAFSCKLARSLGAVPYIRLMMRSDVQLSHVEKRFSLQMIIDGKFDADLKMWALKAREYASPIILEYGTECNDGSRPWSGQWNGIDKHNKPMSTTYGDLILPDGPEEFVSAYRHIVKLIRDDMHCSNITWVFHITPVDNPSTPENAFETYYPGDDFVDWVGVSIYGSKNPHETEPTPLFDLMNDCYPRIQKMAKDKPIVIAELGCTVGKYLTNDKWAKAALADLLSNKWPKVIGFSWWNQRWKYVAPADMDDAGDDDQAGGDDSGDDSGDSGGDLGGDMDDNNPEDFANMRFQEKDNKALLQTFQKILKDASGKIVEAPIIIKQ